MGAAIVVVALFSVRDKSCAVDSNGFWSTRTLVNSYLLLVNSYLSQLVPFFQTMPILGCRTLVSNFSCQITY